MEKITHKLVRLKCKRCSFDQEMTTRLESPCPLSTCPHCFSQNAIFVKSSQYACPTCNGSVRALLLYEEGALCKCGRCGNASEVAALESCEEVV
jgi:hypothetical protein